MDYCLNCGHWEEVHGSDCKGFIFHKDGKSGSNSCHCQNFKSSDRGK